MTSFSSSLLLAGKLAFISGSGSGIGAALARGFADQGATVILGGRRMAPLLQQVKEIEQRGGRAYAYTLDISDPGDCEAVAARVKQELGDISVLVNNAGVIRYAAIDSPEVHVAWKEQMDTNLSGPFNLTMAFLPSLRAAHASVINLGSIAASVYVPVTPGYSAAKAGVHMLTVALARELGPAGVRVNTLAPGVINTSMSNSAANEEKMTVLNKRVALGRIGQVEDLVGPAVFLASDMSEYVTGTTLGVDGGYLTF